MTAFVPVPVNETFGVRLLKVKSPFSPVLWGSCNQAPLAFKAKRFGDLSSWCWTPGLGAPNMGLRTLIPVEELLQEGEMSHPGTRRSP